MSNYYVGISTTYAPLPLESSDYSSWAQVSYSLDPTDVSGVVSTQGHLIKNTIQAKDSYVDYIESKNLRSGWGGTYTCASGQMNVNEGPTQDNCAFYVKYKGEWINLADKTAVEQAGLDSIFELQTVSGTDQRYYVLVRTWEDDNEDKYHFGYTVSIKQNSTLEDFGDSANEAIIIEFLADINSEYTGAHEDTTLGATSPSFVIEGVIKDVEEIWETRTGSLVPGELNLTSMFQNFPVLRRPLQFTPWLTSVRGIKPYYDGTVVFSGMNNADALKKDDCLLGLSTEDVSIDGASVGIVWYNVSTQKFQYYETQFSDASSLISDIKSNPANYSDYRIPSYMYVMLDVIAGGGAGGRAFVKENTADEFAGGGGGGAGGSCRLAVRLIEGDLLLIQAGGYVEEEQHGCDSRVCVLDSNNAVISGVVCGGGRKGSSADRHEGHFAGGSGGAVYWAAADGYSMGQNITYENGIGATGATVVVWDSSKDQYTQEGLVDNAMRIYVIFAATGGRGGRGGDRRALSKSYADKGWQPQYEGGSIFSQFSMITNAFTRAIFPRKNDVSNGGEYAEAAGGCGGHAMNIWEIGAGGDGGIYNPGTPPGGPSARGSWGRNGGGGGGGAVTFYGAASAGNGGAGVIYVCR